MLRQGYLEESNCKGDIFTLLRVYDKVRCISDRHYHEAVEIGIMLKGRNGFIVNGEVKYLSAGQISYISGWDIHNFDIYEGAESITLMIGKQYLRDFYSFYGVGTRIPYFDRVLDDLDANKKILDIVLMIENELPNLTPLKTKGYIDLLFGEMARHYTVLNKQDNEANIDVLGAMLEYINKNYKSDITFAGVAEYVGLTTNYCSMLFHNFIKQDFRNYVNDLRIEEGRKMMEKNPTMRILDVALDCGFRSLNSFYRAYKRVYGQIPRAGRGAENDD